MVVTIPISGRFLAASRNLFRLFTRNSGSLPARSSSTNWNPPEVPTPEIAGGEKAKTVPWGRVRSLRFSFALMTWNCSSMCLRSSHGCSVTQKNAL